MNRTILVTIFILLGINELSAQRKTPELDKQKVEEQKQAENTYGTNDSWKDKFFFGGNIGGYFGNNSSYFLIQPLVGYKITEKLQAGLSPLYIYSSRTFYYANNQPLKISGSVYGPGIFSRYFINDNIFAHVEYLGLTYNTFNEATQKEISRFSNSLFVGGGYSPGGQGMYVVVLYDLLYDSKTSFYSNPLDIRVGFTF